MINGVIATPDVNGNGFVNGVVDSCLSNGQSRPLFNNPAETTLEYDTPEFLAKLLAHCHLAKQTAPRDDSRSQP